MTDERRILKVIEQLYEAASDPFSLADLPAILAPYFRSDSAMLHTCAPRSLKLPAVLATTANFDASACASYVEHYHYVNEWFARGMKKPIGSVIFGHELVDETELLRIEWYDYCQRLNAFHVLGGNIQLSDELIGGIGFQRPRSAKRFDETDRRRLAIILPHLQRALQIQHRFATLTRERAVALEIIEGLAIGVIFVGADARLLFANQIADRVLQSGQGLTVSQGRLRPQDPRYRQDLERLICETARTSAGRALKAGGMLSLPRQAGGSLPVLVAPFRAVSIGYGPAMPAAILIFNDPENEIAAPEKTLQAAFGLTPAQARLASALIAGQTLSNYAERAGISINTAKTLMRQTFQKTGHSRQADLVRAVAANPVFKLAQQ